MWKPGTAKPLPEARDNGDAVAEKPSEERPAAPPKKLSGSTMSMRFMKRNAGKRKEPPTKETSTAASESIPHRPQHEQENDMSEEDEAAFRMASASDMYGPQADVLGRRSFGQFNKAVETAWNGSLEYSIGAGQKRKAVSDEELLQRYEQFVQSGRGEHAPIGNLEAKKKKRNRQKKKLKNLKGLGDYAKELKKG